MKKNIFEEILNDPDFDVLNNLIRWNGTRRIKEESVAHHSYLVTFFARILVENMFSESEYIQKLIIVDYALLHDNAEIFDYDVNHTVKYNKYNGDKIRELLKQYCNERTNQKFNSDSSIDKFFRKNMIVEDMHESHKLIVKAADWMGCVFYISKEIGLGNKALIPKYNLCIKNLKDICKKLVKNYHKVYNMEIIHQILKSNFNIK